MEQKQAAVGMTKLDRENVYEWKKVKDRITTHLVERAGVPFLQFSLLEETGIATHAFSTRLGGVSEGVCSTMNVSFTRGDREEAVRENYRRLGEAVGFDCADLVCSDQTHTTNIRAVTEADRGKGFARPKDYTDIDGLITNVPGLVLGHLLRGLRTAVFCGSGKEGHRPVPFRLAGYGGKDREKDSRTNAGRIWK